MEKQRNLDAQNLKAQLDSIHDVLDTKVPWDFHGRLVKSHGDFHTISWDILGPK